MLCCVLLCCVVLCCVVLCCVVLCCVVLCCVLLCCVVLCCVVLCCVVLCCVVLMGCGAILCLAVLCCAVLCCAVLCAVRRCGVVWCSATCCVVSCFTVLCYTALCCGVLRCGATLPGTECNVFTLQYLRAPTQRPIEALALGLLHTVFLADGTAYAAGSNRAGQLGKPETTLLQEQAGRLDIPGDPTITHIAAGSFHTGVITDSGEAWLTGMNEQGALGLGDTRNRYAFERLVLPGSPAVTALALGRWHSVVLAGSKCYVFGSNTHGKLGLGSTQSVFSSPQELTLTGSPTVTAIGAGHDHTALVADGSLYVMGSNLDGQCGIPGSTTYSSPQKLSTSGFVKKVVLLFLELSLHFPGARPLFLGIFFANFWKFEKSFWKRFGNVLECFGQQISKKLQTVGAGWVGRGQNKYGYPNLASNCWAVGEGVPSPEK